MKVFIGDIRSENGKNKLIKVEVEYKQKLKKISSYTLNKFREAVEEGIIIHDSNIARWVFKAQYKINIPGFMASNSWVQRFKIAHNIVS